jgi:hypothetical protein
VVAFQLWINEHTEPAVCLSSVHSKTAAIREKSLATLFYGIDKKKKKKKKRSIRGNWASWVSVTSLRVSLQGLKQASPHFAIANKGPATAPVTGSATTSSAHGPIAY